MESVSIQITMHKVNGKAAFQIVMTGTECNCPACKGNSGIEALKSLGMIGVSAIEQALRTFDGDGYAPVQTTPPTRVN